MGYIFDDIPAPSDHETHISLSSLVLQAQSQAAYRLATEYAIEFTRWLSSGILIRRGQLLDFTPTQSFAPPQDNVAISFFTLSTHPVQEGRVEGGVTHIVILPCLASSTTRSRTDILSVDEDVQDLEIDESFLSGSMLSPSAPGHIALPGGWSCILSSSAKRNCDDCTVYISPRDLSRTGILSGDWALAHTPLRQTKRLVRVLTAESYSQAQHKAIVSPILAYNLTKSISNLTNESIALRPIQSASAPRIPTARMITIARVASSISTDRTFQSSFLHSLHAYFLAQRRLVKRDDVVGLSINTDDMREPPDTSIFDNGFPGDSTLKDFDPRYISETSNEMVFFKITNVEYNVLADIPSDGFEESIFGEWGCWVDPAVTRIVQTGVEQSRVPPLIECLPLHITAVSTKLRSLISAALTASAESYKLQLSILLSGTRGIGKTFTIRTVAQQLGIHIVEINCYYLIGENDIQTEGTLRARFEKAAACAPSLLVLKHIDALSQSTQPIEAGKGLFFADVVSECTGKLRQSWKLSGYPTVVIATTNHPEQMSPRMTSCFKHEIILNAPDEGERRSVLQAMLSNPTLSPEASFHELALQTAALVPLDLADLAARSERIYLSRVTKQIAYNAHQLYRAGANISAGDLETALNKARTSYAESIGAPKIPNVTWDDVGGLASIKADILDTIQLPLEHPELFSNGMKQRSGILLYGPPGTGKTLLAKAVATSCALNFFSVKGPELLNMYIGESEANVRKVFQRARDAKPCVIFFDELDSVAPKRGNHGDSGGVMDRIVSQLLAELDGIAGGDASADVFVIGATNRPDLLDPALLRPGRFDRMLYLGVSQTHEAQLNILQALTRKFKLHPELNLQKVAEACPFHYTGADFYALCSDALLKAMSRKAEELDRKIAVINAGTIDPKHPYPLTPQYYLAEIAITSEIEVLVTQEDFDSALSSLIPSVSQNEMEHYARVQQQFSKETINSR